MTRVSRGPHVAAVLLLFLFLSPSHAHANTFIFVTTTDDKISGSGGCSLKEAIYAADLGGPRAIDSVNPDGSDHYISGLTTACEFSPIGGSGPYTIVLPSKATFTLSTLAPDAHNPFGPTATPIIIADITIEGNGSTLVWTSSTKSRLFAIGTASIPLFGATLADCPQLCAEGTGSLTLHNLYIKGFTAKGGDGGPKAGGGLGAGGAIYVKDGSLRVEDSTFDGNTAIGGDGHGGDSAGGGGGMGGNGGDSFSGACCGGGGGSRGNGGSVAFSAGGGGGTFSNGHSILSNGGSTAGGQLCGGAGATGISEVDENGLDAPCAGGGGGGSFFDSGHGGNGNRGGGGGGGYDTGGDGGFGGGGGGAGNGTNTFSTSGGNGGFGGGGGGGDADLIGLGGGGHKGTFGGGGGSSGCGGGGAGLGGAVFNEKGSVVVRNSTFAGNGAVGGGKTCGDAGSGEGHGGAIFSLDGSTTVENATIANGGASGSGGGIYIYQENASATTTFVLRNTIVGSNASGDCVLNASVITGGDWRGNLIDSNDGIHPPCDFNDGSGTVSTADPQLGPLQDNGGLTPTMAIPKNSPAWGAADSTTSLPVDQRGWPRPSLDGHGFDIGAFELCTPATLEQPAPCILKITEGGGNETVQLTVQASPVAGGTTTPAAATYPEPLNAVVLLNATPNLGYYFSNWTGPVTNGATFASNAVTMTQTTGVSANFQLHNFSLAANPITLVLPLGGSASSTVTASSLGDFADSVTLTASGPPPGVASGLSTRFVTPAPSTSASSVISFLAGSSVTPQTFVETITGTSAGIAGALTHGAQVTVTVQSTAGAIVGVVNQDQALGCIDTSGVVPSLVAKLNAYQTLANGGQLQGATNVLSAFEYEVQAQAGKHISPTCTDPVGGNQFSPSQTLVTDAQALQAGLGTQVKANPIVGSVVGSNGIGIAGATVTLMGPSKTVVATTTTDAVGFYYFAGTSELTPGATYTVTVTVPKGYSSKAGAPTAQTFTWSAAPLLLANVVVN